MDCTSGPVQKMTQHLQKKHRMDAVTAAQHSKKKVRALLEAVSTKMPNPRTRSSGLQHLGYFVNKMKVAQMKKTTARPPHTLYHLHQPKPVRPASSLEITTRVENF